MGKENGLETTNCGDSGNNSSPVKNEDLAVETCYSSDKEAGMATCRVCQCVESDIRGEAALGFLDITLPVQKVGKGSEASKSVVDEKNSKEKNDGLIEIICPGGDVFICTNDVEAGGAWTHRDTLVELGCSCKNDLALVHYSCALKWFLNHGSTVCEICGNVAENVSSDDFEKVVTAVKDYTELKERTGYGDATGTDADAVTAIRRQQLSEISLWFCPHGTTNNNNNSNNNNNNGYAAVPFRVISEQPMEEVHENGVPMESCVTRWAVEGTGILLATGLLTVTLAWLIAPRVGYKTANNGLHVLLGGLCALTIVIFLRFVVLARIRYGPARYWALLFVFWFLVFGIWASRSRSE